MTYDFDENILYVFTDGASRKVFNEKLKRRTGRNGGKGIRFVYLDKKGKEKGEDKSEYKSYTNATNQDMELRACVDGLDAVLDSDLDIFNKIMVVTDSDFIYKYRKYALHGGRDRSGRKTIDGNQVVHKRKRKELIKNMKEIIMIQHKNIDFDLVKGHKDNEYNNKADASAVKGAQSKTRMLGNNSETRQKFFKKTIWFKKGFLPIYGQEVLIHIYISRYLGKKQFRYDYEMVSWNHEYFMNAGWIYYDKTVLSAEFIYLLKIKNDGSNQIEEVLGKYTKDEIRKKMIEDGISPDIFLWKQKHEEEKTE